MKKLGLVTSLASLFLLLAFTCSFAQMETEKHVIKVMGDEMSMKGGCGGHKGGMEHQMGGCGKGGGMMHQMGCCSMGSGMMGCGKMCSGMGMGCGKMGLDRVLDFPGHVSDRFLLLGPVLEIQESGSDAGKADRFQQRKTMGPHLDPNLLDHDSRFSIYSCVRCRSPDELRHTNAYKNHCLVVNRCGVCTWVLERHCQ